MKDIDTKSLIIGALLASTIFLGVGCGNAGQKAFDDKSKEEVAADLEAQRIREEKFRERGEQLIKKP